MTTDTFDKDINLLIINFNEDLNKYNGLGAHCIYTF